MDDDTEVLLPRRPDGELDPFSDDEAVELDSILGKEIGLSFDDVENDTHVYAVEDTGDLEAGGLQEPETAYIQREDLDRWPKNSIVTIGARGSSGRRLRRRLSDASIASASSGITILEVPPPQRMLDVLQAQAPGTYKISVKETKSEPRPAVKYTLLPLEYNDRMATTKFLQFLSQAYPMPRPTGSRWYNDLRYGFFSIYRRIFTLVMIINLIVLFVMAARVVYYSGSLQLGSFSYGEATTAVAANLFVATVMRNDHCINLIFHTALSLPHWVPLWIRKQAAKVYSYGGIHSGCGVAAFLWYIFFAALVIHQFRGTGSETDALAITTALMLLLFVILVVLSHPRIRIHFHDVWELSHRYAGWTSIAIVWAQIFIICSAGASRESRGEYIRSMGSVLITTPAFWLLAAITALIIYPWLHLRRRTFESEQLSSHAIRLKFNYRKVSFQDRV